MTDSQTTQEHDIIKSWVEERGGTPSKIEGYGGEDSGIVRINFPGYSGEETLKEISWDEFFRIFDDNNLTFLYQEKTTDGEKSNFNKFIIEE